MKREEAIALIEQGVNKIYDEHEAQMKEANRIKDVFRKLSFELANELIAQMKAKDEEIERLNCRAYHSEGYISDLHNHTKDKKFYDAKARSIVAMLFWNYKRNLFAFDVEATVVVESKRIFEKAYKMLKDNK